MLYAKKSSDGRPKKLESTDTGELKVLLCGVDENGNIRPLMVDETGKIILSAL